MDTDQNEPNINPNESGDEPDRAAQEEPESGAGYGNHATETPPVTKPKD